MAESPGRPDFAQIVPKAEIHLHLEGSVDLETLMAILRARGEPSGPDVREHFLEIYQHRDFQHFLRNFRTLCAEIRRPEDFALITAALSERLRTDGARYAEVFCSPQIFTRAGLPAGEMIEVIHAAARTGQEDGGPRLVFLFDGVRQFGIGAMEEVVEMAAACRAYGVIGIGVGGDEKALPTAAFEGVFREARRLGLRTTIHAGEFDGPRSVWEAIEVLGAERIGHGIRAAEDEVLIRTLRAHAIPLECCPTSNLRTGVVRSWETHPIRILHEKGVAVTVNSDDPALFGTSIAGEWRALETRLGLDRKAVLAIGARTVRASFLEEGAKADLLAAMSDAAGREEFAT